MTNTNSAISLAQLVSALQSLGVDVTSLPHEEGEPRATTPQSQPTSSATPVVSARISSPWVATCAVSPAPPAPHGAQPEQHEGALEAKMATQGSPSSAAPATSPALSATSPATSAVPSNVPSGFMCQYCQQYNTLRSAGDTWYTVTAGRNVGVFRGWHRVQPLVSGVPHASYRKYSSETAAAAAFEDARAEGLVVVIN